MKNFVLKSLALIFLLVIYRDAEGADGSNPGASIGFAGLAASSADLPDLKTERHHCYLVIGRFARTQSGVTVDTQRQFKTIDGLLTTRAGYRSDEVGSRQVYLAEADRLTLVALNLTPPFSNLRVEPSFPVTSGSVGRHYELSGMQIYKEHGFLGGISIINLVTRSPRSGETPTARFNWSQGKIIPKSGRLKLVPNLQGDVYLASTPQELNALRHRILSENQVESPGRQEPPYGEMLDEFFH